MLGLWEKHTRLCLVESQIKANEVKREEDYRRIRNEFDSVKVKIDELSAKIGDIKLYPKEVVTTTKAEVYSDLKKYAIGALIVAIFLGAIDIEMLKTLIL